MRPIYKTVTVIDDNGIDPAIAQAQAVVQFAFFDLNGTLVSGGIASLSLSPDASGNDGKAQTLTLISGAANVVTHELFITGTDSTGATSTETLLTPSTAGDTTVHSANFYSTVTSIEALDAVSDVLVTWDATGQIATNPLPTNYLQSPGNITLGIQPVPNTSASDVLATIQYTLDDPEKPFNSYANEAGWRSPTNLTDGSGNGLSISADSLLEGPIRAVRGLAGDGVQGDTLRSWQFTIIQGLTT